MRMCSVIVRLKPSSTWLRSSLTRLSLVRSKVMNTKPFSSHQAMPSSLSLTCKWFWQTGNFLPGKQTAFIRIGLPPSIFVYSIPDGMAQRQEGYDCWYQRLDQVQFNNFHIRKDTWRYSWVFGMLRWVKVFCKEVKRHYISQDCQAQSLKLSTWSWRTIGEF